MATPKKVHPNVRRSLSLPPWVDQWLVDEAEREGLPVSRFVVLMIACYRGHREVDWDREAFMRLST